MVGLPGGRLRAATSGASARWPRPYCLLHVPPVLDDLRRDLPRHGGAGEARPRVAEDHDRPAADPRRGLGPGRASWAFPRCSGAAPNFIERFLEPAFEHAHHALGEVFAAPVPGHGVEWGSWASASLIAVAGILVAWRFYQGAFEIPNRLAASFPGAYRTLLNKYWVDELYGGVFVPGPRARRRPRAHANDRSWWTGATARCGRGSASTASPGACATWWRRPPTSGTAGRGRRGQLRGLRPRNLSYALRAVQTGLVQHYALSMMIGLFLLIAAGRFLLGLQGHQSTWTSTGSTSSPSSPTRLLVGALVLLLPSSPARARRTRCAGWPTASASSASWSSLPLWFWFDRGGDGFQFVERAGLDPCDRRQVPRRGGRDLGAC